MGFFSSIKKNLNHGGVKVKLESPGSARSNDPAIAVTITLSAEEPQTVDHVTLELRKTYPVQQDRPSRPDQTVASLTLPGFPLAAGESKTIPASLPLSTTGLVGAGGANLTAAGVPAEAAGALAALAGVADKFAYLAGDGGATYNVQVSADVVGITLDPSDSNGISINHSGEFGTTVNL